MRLLAFKPEVAQLLDSLEERVYFTKRRVSNITHEMQGVVFFTKRVGHREHVAFQPYVDRAS